MKIIVTLPCDAARARFFPLATVARLERCGDVRWNPHARALVKDELKPLLEDATVCVTGWGTVRLDDALLGAASAVQLVAHVGGTVASVASEELYRRGVRVCSGNHVLARQVAEGVLAYALTGLRNVPHFDRALHQGQAWPRDVNRVESLFSQTIGFVGLGTVGRHLLDLLRPFEVSVRVFDPYLAPEALAAWPFAQAAELEPVLAESAIVSIHASLTPETEHLLNGPRLRLLRSGCLLINTARGAIVDEAALAVELGTGRFRAVLDVFEVEPLPADSPLRTLDNAILVPHLAGAPSHPLLALAMVEDIERFQRGEPLRHEIPLTHFQRMTRPVGAGR